MVEAQQVEQVVSSQHFEINGQKLINGRYLRMEELESGSFATIYKAKDCYIAAEVGTESNPNVRPPRLLSEAHLNLVQVMAKVSPEIEFVMGDPDDFSEEKKQAIEVL